MNDFSLNWNGDELVEIVYDKIATFFLIQHLFFGGGSTPGIVEHIGAPP